MPGQSTATAGGRRGRSRAAAHGAQAGRPGERPRQGGVRHARNVTGAVCGGGVGNPFQSRGPCEPGRSAGEFAIAPLLPLRRVRGRHVRGACGGCRRARGRRRCRRSARVVRELGVRVDVLRDAPSWRRQLASPPPVCHALAAPAPFPAPASSAPLLLLDFGWTGLPWTGRDGTGLDGRDIHD